MKRLLILGMAVWLGGVSLARAQSGASAAADRQAAEELNARLTGKIQDLSEAQDALRRQIEDLRNQVKELREHQSANPKVDAVERDEFHKLAEQVKDIEEKRQADNKVIRDSIAALAKIPVAGTKPVKQPKVPEAPSGDDTTPAPPSGNYEGYEHSVKSGETLIAIVKAYNKEYDLKLTVDQLLKHPMNAKVKPEKLYVGQKVFIPSK